MNVGKLKDILDLYEDHVEIYFVNESGRLENFSLDLEEVYMDEKMKLSLSGEQVLATFSARNI